MIGFSFRKLDYSFFTGMNYIEKQYKRVITLNPFEDRDRKGYYYKGIEISVRSFYKPSYVYKIQLFFKLKVRIEAPYTLSKENPNNTKWDSLED